MRQSQQSAQLFRGTDTAPVGHSLTHSVGSAENLCCLKVDVNATQAMVLLGADLSVLCPNRALLRAMTKANNRAIYSYFYTYDQTGDGAIHAAELESVFGSRNTSSHATQLFPYNAQLSKKIRSYWTSFAARGLPMLHNGPRWPQFGSGQSEAEMQLGDVVRSSGVTQWRSARCDFWSNYTIANPKTAAKRMRAAALLLPIVVDSRL